MLPEVLVWGEQHCTPDCLSCILTLQLMGTLGARAGLPELESCSPQRFPVPAQLPLPSKELLGTSREVSRERFAGDVSV